jgi:hypothetical protein
MYIVGNRAAPASWFVFVFVGSYDMGRYCEDLREVGGCFIQVRLFHWQTNGIGNGIGNQGKGEERGNT